MRYSDLVIIAQTEVSSRAEKDYRNKTVIYRRCELWEKGNQINLWTYWQGFQLKNIDEKGVDILLVGQDWGNPDRNPEVVGTIKRIQSGDRSAVYPCNASVTDRNLVELFKIYGCDITKREPGKRIFFTNYSLGYRKGSETGGMTKGLMRKDSELFDELVTSIKPRVIICLGKITFEMVSHIVTKGFLEKLRNGEPWEAVYPSDKTIRVYGVAHCGARGLSNVGGMEIMKKAWEKIVL
ncbi:MAG: hypothetical protein K6B44_04610 [Lachnospiraceae bacterium]|nr:hypothetical protein [Lachnospiraceae bacterium]